MNWFNEMILTILPFRKWQREVKDLLLPVLSLVSFFLFFISSFLFFGGGGVFFLCTNFPLWLTASSQQTFVKESEIILQPHVVLTTESHLFWKWTLISNAQTRQTHSGWHRETQKEALSFTSCLINPQPVVLVLLTGKENVSINTTDMLYFPYYND